MKRNSIIYQDGKAWEEQLVTERGLTEQSKLFLSMRDVQLNPKWRSTEVNIQATDIKLFTSFSKDMSRAPI